MNNIISQGQKNEIDNICQIHGIKKYSINNDGSINVYQDVKINLSTVNYRQNNTLPLEFNKVVGNFDCSNNQLSSLEGCPNEVTGDFDCSANRILSLIGCPTKVGGNFDCHENFNLSSLKYCPNKIGGDFDCGHSQIKSLEHMPNKINGDFIFLCNNLDTLNHSPKEITGDFFGECNALKSLIGGPFKVGGNYSIGSNPLTSLDGYPIELGGNLNFSHCDTVININGVNIISSEGTSLEDEEPDNETYIFTKYHKDYEVWTPKINVDNLNDLLSDIKDGLK